jgi:hypothetical protein
MRALFLVLALASCSATAETVSEIRAKIRPIYAQMCDHDWWSATQLEAWAQLQGIQLGPVLGSDSLVFGNPAFATPEDVVALRDFGDQVQVITNERWHCFAADGHPLAASVPFHLLPARVGFSSTGHFVGVVAYDPDVSFAWKLHVLGVPQGDIQLDTGGTELSGHLIDKIVVSSDGTAAVLSFLDVGADRNWAILSIAQRPRLQLDDLVNVQGVGTNGIWILAAQRAGTTFTPTLVVDGKVRTPLLAGAPGPGIAMVVTNDGHCSLVTREGQLKPFRLPINLGSHPQLVTVGEYLVVSSGGGAKSLDDTDILGATMPDPPEQPDTLACFRWADILAKADNVQPYCFAAPLSIDTNQSAALFLWHEKEVKRLDLSAAKPRLLSLGSYDQKVTWVWSSDFWSVVSQGDISCVVNDQGQVLYSGPGRITVGDRDSALVSTGSEEQPDISYVHLAVDPKDRAIYPLAGESGNRVFNQPHNEGLLVNERDQVHWHTLDRQGKRTNLNGMYGPKAPKPIFSWIDATDGRVFSMHGRTFLKAGQEKGRDDWLWPQDAWFFDEATMLVLTQQSHLLKYGSGRKGLEWSDLGRCDYEGLYFGLRDQSPVLIDWSHQIHGTISDSLVLTQEDAGRGLDLPMGPWQVHKLDFVPPATGECHWTDLPLGYIPRLLRSNKDAPGLVTITSSLVIILGKEEAVLMAHRH